MVDRVTSIGRPRSCGAHSCSPQLYLYPKGLALSRKLIITTSTHHLRSLVLGHSSSIIFAVNGVNDPFDYTYTHAHTHTHPLTHTSHSHTHLTLTHPPHTHTPHTHTHTPHTHTMHTHTHTQPHYAPLTKSLRVLMSDCQKKNQLLLLLLPPPPQHLTKTRVPKKQDC